MKNKILIVLAILLLIFSVFTGCSGKTTDSKEDTIKITGFKDGQEIAFTIDELQKLPVFDGRVEGMDSAGEPVIYNVKGAYLKDLLKEYDRDKNDIEGLRLVATDGYSIEIQKDIISKRDILLGYEMDGEPLDEENAPLRVFIPEERAMYWARMVCELAVLREKVDAETSCIYMLETVSNNMDLEDFEFFGSTDKVINTKKFIEQYNVEGQDTILLQGADGLEKFETIDNVKKGVIKVSGKYAPMFTSDVLPVGMFVKDMILIKYGTNVFYSATKGAESKDVLSLKDILDASGMKVTEKCTLATANDVLEVSADALGNYIIRVSTDNEVVVYDKATEEIELEGLLSIK